MTRAGASIAAVALAAVVCARPAHAVEVSTLEAVSSNVRLRTPLPGDRSRNWLTFDLEFLPVLQGTLRWSRTSFMLRLNPSVLLREPHLSSQLFALAAGQAQLTTRGERWDLAVAQDASYGIQDVGTLRNPDGSLPTGVPEVQTVGAVPFMRSGTTVTLNGAPSRRTAYTLLAGYLVQGSPDPTNVTLPLQWGPQARAVFRYQATRPDWLATAAQVSQATFSTGQQQLISMVTQAWDRTWTPRIFSTAGAGVALTRETIIFIPGGPQPGDYFEVLPVVYASAGTRERIKTQVLTFDVGARMAPFADRFTGAVYERVEANAQMTWMPERNVTLRPNAGFAYAVPVGRAVQAGDQLAFVEGTATWWPLQWLGLVAYSRVAVVSQPRLNIVNQLQWVATLSVVLQDQRSWTW